MRLAFLRLRGVLVRALARLAMRLVPPAPLALVAGLPDAEENSLVTALALAGRFRGEVALVVADPAEASALLARVARLLDAPALAERVRLRPKSDPRTAWAFVRARWVLYTHGLYDSPRPVGRRVHVNLWHGTGPKWNVNARQSQRIGADVLAAYGEVWGRQVALALRMPPGTRVVPGNPRQDVLLSPGPRSALAALGLDPGRPLLLWLPTFRRSARAARFGLAEGEPLGGREDAVLRRLFAECRELGVQLVLKTHRHDDDDYSRLGVRRLTTEDLTAAGLTLHQLLGHADGVLSDYSSAWVDFLVTGRSVALHCPDLERYERERGLNAPPLREVAGGLLLDEDGAAELARDLAAGCVFRPAALAAAREALGVEVRPGPRAAAMLDSLLALARERHGEDLGLT